MIFCLMTFNHSVCIPQKNPTENKPNEEGISETKTMIKVKKSSTRACFMRSSLLLCFFPFANWIRHWIYSSIPEINLFILATASNCFTVSFDGVRAARKVWLSSLALSTSESIQVFFFLNHFSNGLPSALFYNQTVECVTKGEKHKQQLSCG